MLNRNFVLTKSASHMTESTSHKTKSASADAPADAPVDTPDLKIVIYTAGTSY